MSKTKPINYFFLDGELHRRLHINRSLDKILTWNYPQGKRMTYVYSQVKKNRQRAFTLVEAGKLMNRKRLAMERAILDGAVPTPQMTYSFNENRRNYKYMLSEDDVIEFWRYFASKHRGAPRKDGGTTPAPIPTEREVRAMMKQETIFYVKTADGFVPTFEAEF